MRVLFIGLMVVLLTIDLYLRVYDPRTRIVSVLFNGGLVLFGVAALLGG